MDFLNAHHCVPVCSAFCVGGYLCCVEGLLAVLDRLGLFGILLDEGDGIIEGSSTYVHCRGHGFNPGLR